MNARLWLIIAGIGTGLVSVALLALAVPPAAWTTDAVVSAVILFLSFASPAVLPAPMPKGTRGDSNAIWLIGPLSKLFVTLLLIAIIAVGLSLSGAHTAAWMACVVWFGSYVIGYAILQAASSVVADAAAQTRSAKDDVRTQWLGRIANLQSRASVETRPSLNRIAEAVQYAANDLPDHDATENAAIDAALSNIESHIDQPDELSALISSVEALLAQRERSLKAARSYA